MTGAVKSTGLSLDIGKPSVIRGTLIMEREAAFSKVTTFYAYQTLRLAGPARVFSATGAARRVGAETHSPVPNTIHSACRHPVSRGTIGAKSMAIRRMWTNIRLTAQVVCVSPSNYRRRPGHMSV